MINVRFINMFMTLMQEERKWNVFARWHSVNIPLNTVLKIRFHPVAKSNFFMNTSSNYNLPKADNIRQLCLYFWTTAKITFIISTCMWCLSRWLHVWHENMQFVEMSSQQAWWSHKQVSWEEANANIYV